MNCSTPGFPVLHYLPEFAQTHIHWVNDAIQPSRPLTHPFSNLPSIFPSIRVFSTKSALHIRWPKYWSVSISSSSSSELILFRIDRFDFLAVQGTLKSLLQHHSSKAAILWCPDFFMVQLSLLSSDFFSFYLIFLLFQDAILLLAVLSPWTWKLLSDFLTPWTDHTVYEIL